MILDEAIKRNRVVVDRLIEQSWPFDAQAVLLGIEALKAVKDARANNYYTPIAPLPGETKK